MENWIETVFKKWNSEGVKINEGASIELIKAVEEKLNFIFPDDFKAFYQKINGFKDLDWQEHMFCFWSLERIVEEFEEPDDEDFIGFCDFFTSSSYFGYKKNCKGIFKRYSMHQVEATPFAQTFEEVVGLINSSNDLIY